MLVLSRKIGERIFIEPGIEISILKMQGQHVKIGIVAPRELSVMRSELLQSEPESCDFQVESRMSPSVRPARNSSCGKELRAIS